MLAILQKKKCISADLGHLLGNLGQVLSFLADDETMEPRRSRYHTNGIAISLCKNTSQCCSSFVFVKIKSGKYKPRKKPVFKHSLPWRKLR